MIDGDRAQMGPTPHIPIVFMMVLIIGIIVTAEVFEQTGVDPGTVAADIPPEAWLLIGGVVVLLGVALGYQLNRSGYRPPDGGEQS